MVFGFVLTFILTLFFQSFSTDFPKFPQGPKCSRRDMAFWRVNAFGQTECDMRYAQYISDLEQHCQALEEINGQLSKDRQIDFPKKPEIVFKRIFQKKESLPEMFEYIEKVKECHQELIKRIKSSQL